ncbi:SprT family zinc-dependent metalloprotease [Breoghania sp. L-A4]|uniref:M48 family metallopeptidase n=1 Tax=Breoghania sp. L-A4 TaxID=2304600 RepID=UPI000E35EC8D|nr:SprT family zinc-dependent metalloprotease [Breoghania sp. L-A4]AXS38835.1 M48 family peptidase [Breoghania sp. L-A4]
MNFLARRRPDDPDHLTLDIDGRAVRITLKRNPRATRYSLRIPASGGDPVLSMPARGSLSAAREFAARNGGWLSEKLARVPKPIVFAAGIEIPLRDVAHLIAAGGAQRGTVHLAEDDDQPRIVVPGGEDHLARRLTDWLKREARADLGEAVARHATNLGRKPTGITVRDTRSRWGSCSSSGKLSFSWRLVLAPPEILDYVAAHEVAHLAEMNHSDRFWRVTEGLFPGTPRARQWLRDHGMQLHRYG